MGRAALIGLSAIAHVALAASLGRVSREPAPERVMVAVIEAPPEPPPPPPPPPERPPEQATATRAKGPAENAPPRAPKAAAKATSVQSNAQAGPVDAVDLGLTLDGPGGGGISVPAAAAGPAEAKAAAPKASRAAPVQKAAQEDCAEAPSKARPQQVPQPAYPPGAREAGVEGKVRVEVTLDDGGKVLSARVLSGLGHGLDEAALAAARRATFSPAQRCGKPVPSTFVIAMRFTLG